MTLTHIQAKKSGGRSGYRAPNAANSSTQGAAAGANTVMRLADKPPTESGEKGPRYGDMETQHAHRNGHFYNPEGFTRSCDHCGREYTAKRDTSRFCSGRCRVAAHRQRQGQREEK